MSDQDDDFDIDLSKGASNLEGMFNAPFAIGKLVIGVGGIVFKLAAMMIGIFFPPEK